MDKNNCLKISTLLAILLFTILNPSISKADTKSDIAAYEAAIKIEDIDKAIDLAKIAFDNAVRDLDAENVYIAKIGYDLASLQMVMQNEKDALAPIEAARNIVLKNPNLISSNELFEIEIIYGISLYSNTLETNKKGDIEKAIKSLETATSNISKDGANAYYLPHAYTYIAKYYAKKQQYKKSAQAADAIIQTANIAYKSDDPKQNEFLIIGYTLRGLSIFVNSIRSSSPIIRNDFKLSPENTPINDKKWYDALGDVAKARIIYGKSKSETDNSFYSLSALDNLINAYASENYQKDQIKKVNESIYGDNIKKFADDDNKEICKSKIKINQKIDYKIGYISHNTFGTSIAKFDLDENNKITNIRILASLPDKEFGEDVLQGLKYAPPASVAPDTPEICKKNYLLNVFFLTK